VIVRAFQLLYERGFCLKDEKEDGITAALRSIIENDLRQNGSVKGFSYRTYESVIRQGQVSNYDFKKPAKAPDLFFKLRNSDEEPGRVVSEHHAIFVECKPVDKRHAAGRYCDAGLSRFVEGDYAWAMEEALMLGYARHGRTIARHLIPAMQEPARLERLGTAELPRPVEELAVGTDNAEPLYVSRHRRNFNWVADKGEASDILVYHSWHKCG